MAGIIIWIIIIVLAVAYNKRNVGGKNPPRPQGTAASAGGQKSARQTNGPTGKEDPWASHGNSSVAEQQRVLKERLARKNQASASVGGGDILSRAKASVEEDFGRTWEQEEQQRRETEKRREEQERQRPREQQREQERQRPREQQRQRSQEQRRQMRQEGRQGEQEQPETAGSLAPSMEGLFLDGGLSLSPGMAEFDGQKSFDLEEVWDLMVKGPNLELTFSRDFIAEGVEMLNRIQA